MNTTTTNWDLNLQAVRIVEEVGGDFHQIRHDLEEALIARKTNTTTTTTTAARAPHFTPHYTEGEVNTSELILGDSTRLSQAPAKYIGEGPHGERAYLFLTPLSLTFRREDYTGRKALVLYGYTLAFEKSLPYYIANPDFAPFND